MYKVVTIDGPAGAGKSTTAKELARRLNWSFLDTGAMYRVVTLAALESGVEMTDQQAMGQLAEGLCARFADGRVWLGDRDVTGLIREPEISRASGFAANAPQVRATLVNWQRRAAQESNLVTEGRDQGTIVFPDAIVKFYLEASDEERARRRHQELVAKGHDITFHQVLDEQLSRDGADINRDIAPLRMACDGVRVESTNKSLEDVIDEMLSHILPRLNLSDGPNHYES